MFAFSVYEFFKTRGGKVLSGILFYALDFAIHILVCSAHFCEITRADLHMRKANPFFFLLQMHDDFPLIDLDVCNNESNTLISAGW